MTVTVAHHYGNSLQSVLERLDALGRFVMAGRGGLTQTLKRSGVGYLGSYTVMEVTHGGSGWHPHKHYALFIDSALTPEQVAQLEAGLRKRAAESDKGHRDDLNFSPDVALTLKAGITGTYLSKWGLAEELALSASKDARSLGNRTPWEFLDVDSTQNRMLWGEYVEATKGRQQTRYSPGLLAVLGVQDDLTDEELAAQPETGPDPVLFTVSLSRTDYMTVYRKMAFAEVLYVAAQYGPAALGHLITSLAEYLPN
jgi:hypothetical protein